MRCPPVLDLVHGPGTGTAHQTVDECHHQDHNQNKGWGVDFVCVHNVYLFG